ncbi:MAG: hypothetical protein DRJ50_08630, partial [Actinobacteria bacterium]
MTTLKNFTDIDAEITLEASADMDDPYRCVKQGATNTDTCDICDTAGEYAIGVIGQSWDDGEFCSIQRSGIATIVAGAAVASGAMVAVDASGRVITALNTHAWRVGYALTAASAAGDEIAVLWDPAPMAAAAYGVKTMKVRVAAASGGFAGETTLFTLPAKAVVQTVYVDVITAEATGTTKTMDVGTAGTSNDPDGYLDGIDVSGTGQFRPVYTNAAVTAGVLLSDDEDGSGALVPTHDETSGGDPVTASPAAA